MTRKRRLPAGTLSPGDDWRAVARRRGWPPHEVAFLEGMLRGGAVVRVTHEAATVVRDGSVVVTSERLATREAFEYRMVDYDAMSRVAPGPLGDPPEPPDVVAFRRGMPEPPAETGDPLDAWRLKLEAAHDAKRAAKRAAKARPQFHR